jgi:hypothetical protein
LSSTILDILISGDNSNDDGGGNSDGARLRMAALEGGDHGRYGGLMAAIAKAKTTTALASNFFLMTVVVALTAGRHRIRPTIHRRTVAAKNNKHQEKK